MVRIAIVDYTPLVEIIYTKLWQRGYKDIKAVKELFQLEKPDEFDVILMHPGIDFQKEAMQFALDHPKTRTALLTPTPGDYSHRIRCFAYHETEEIIDFIEGKPIRIGLFDYNGKALPMEKAKTLRALGYEAECVDSISELESFDVALIHPGVNNQADAVEFYKKHPGIKTAIITPSTTSYIPEDDIPILSYNKLGDITRFADGRTVKEILKAFK